MHTFLLRLKGAMSIKFFNKSKLKVSNMKTNIKNRQSRNKALILSIPKFLIAGLTFSIFLLTAAMGAGNVNVSFLYNLSDFSGPVLLDWPNVYVDKQRDEIYVADTETRTIRVFNENGMEVHHFGDDGSLGTIIDMTVDSNGNIIALSKTVIKTEIILCNFRGEQISQIALKNLPPDFSPFHPDRIIYREGRLYLAATGLLKIAVADRNGLFEHGYDVAAILGVSDTKRGETDISGFTLDREGNMLFTIPVLFSAYRLLPDSRIEVFGKSGSAPGQFGIVAGIATDEKGYIYISDRLKSVVMVFDNAFEFQSEFGYRGYRPGNIIVPNDIDIDNAGRVYVTQAGERGVSVFKISYN